MKRLSLSTHIIIALQVIVFSSCKKFMDVPPPNDRLVNSTVFATDASAEAAVIGIYADMMNKDFSYTGGTINWYCGLASDELINYSTNIDQAEFYTNSLTPVNLNIKSLWQQPYSHIYAANAILENLDRSESISLAVKKRLSGEAKFIRGFAHFYLANLFGRVPLILSTDYSANTNANNSDSALLYQQIIDDLENATALLPNNYAVYNDQRTRPTSMAAQALLARAYLYSQQWEKADATASAVIDNPLFSLDAVENVFLKNSSETIWQLIPLLTNTNTAEARFFVLTDNPANTLGAVSLRSSFANSFEPGDLRRQWINSFESGANEYHYPYKYHETSPGVLSEYYIVLRLAEQLLIRAEARIQLNQIAGGIDDINGVRARARDNQSGSLPPVSALGLDQENALAIVDTERRVELFAEWGHRWFDLKRRGKTNEALGGLKGSNWQNNIDQLFPIPQNQMLSDPNIDQNFGY